MLWFELLVISWLVSSRRAVCPGPLGVIHSRAVQPQKPGVMDANTSDRQSLVMETVIQFMCQPGNAERALARHRRLPDGLCSGCLTQLTEWPCTVANFAMQAQQRQR